MQHRTLTIDGTRYSFVHLAPFVRRVMLHLRGELRKEVEVSFAFSCHCYSRGLAAGETAPAGHEVPDGSTHHPRPRVFDRERYELSKALVSLIDALIACNGAVTRSRHDNFFRVDTVDTGRACVGRPVAYFIFMHARKVHEPGRPKSIRIMVESAYPETDGIPHPTGRGSRSLGEMLGEHWG